MAAHLYLGDSATGRENSLRAAFEYIGVDKDLSESAKVFVKPNFTYPRPVRGVTTSREMLEQTLSLLSESGAEVFVGESNGGYGSFLASEAFAGHRLSDICKASNTQAIDLSTQETVEVADEIGGKRPQVALPRILVQQIDFSVSIPVLKVHAMTTVSLSIKNLWGCYPTDLRLLEHKELDRKLALISRLVKARYGVVDATYGLDWHGPMDGEARFLGKFVASDNLLALDTSCARMMGFDPRKIRHLRNQVEFAGDLGEPPALETNVDLAGYEWNFALHRNFID